MWGDASELKKQVRYGATRWCSDHKADVQWHPRLYALSKARPCSQSHSHTDRIGPHQTRLCFFFVTNMSKLQLIVKQYSPSIALILIDILAEWPRAATRAERMLGVERFSKDNKAGIYPHHIHNFTCIEELTLHEGQTNFKDLTWSLS